MKLRLVCEASKCGERNVVLFIKRAAGKHWFENAVPRSLARYLMCYVDCAGVHAFFSCGVGTLAFVPPKLSPLIGYIVSAR